MGALLILPVRGETYQIHTLHQFRLLDQAAAKQRPSLKLKAFVNLYVPERNRLYIESGEDASYAFAVDSNLRPQFRRGDLVEFTGHAEEGGLAPNVAFSTYRILRHHALPAPPGMSIDRMALPTSECRNVRLTGRILAAYFVERQGGTYESGGLELAVGSPDSKVEVMIDHPSQLDPAKLVGADVELEGTVAHSFQRGQFLGSMLFVQEASELHITKPVLVDPFTLPLRKVDELLRFGGRDRTERAHIQGVVISRGLSESVFIQDDTQGILVESFEPIGVEPGQVVDVVGYPQPGPYSPVLRYAIFRKPGLTRKVNPFRLSSLDIPVFYGQDYAGTWLVHDGEFVELEAELIGQRVSILDTSLLLRSGKNTFSAKLPARQGSLANLKTGSLLRMRGVCTVLVAGVHHRPDGMELLLRSPADIDILRAPPWWTGVRPLWALCSALALLCSLAGWILTLRSRVRAQTAQLRDRATLDGLTRIWNRAEILSLLGRHLDYARNSRSALSITLIDLDHFKSINDNYGHQAGDAVLVDVCARLRQNIRNTDAIGRYGGEELLIVQPGLHCGTSEAQTERLRQAVAGSPVFFDTRPIAVTCSLGVSCSIDGFASLDHLIKAADAALYQAKRDGRNRAAFRPLARVGVPEALSPALTAAPAH